MTFEWGTRTYLMGIINVTPDSFSGDGILPRAGLGIFTKAGPWYERVVEQGRRMESEGADIVDVGGESTRPGSTPVSPEEELARVIPVIEQLAKEVKIPISIDTYKAEVARQAIAAGARMINDVWGGRMDPEKPKDAEQTEKLGGRYVGVEYKDLLGEIKKELQECVDAALAAGVKKEHIIIDPGIGFGKTVEQNLELVRHLHELQTLDFPILVGPSRKSFVGYTLNLPADQRLEGTLAAVTLCIEKGADIVRVHDVQEADRVRRFTDAVVRG